MSIRFLKPQLAGACTLVLSLIAAPSSAAAPTQASDANLVGQALAPDYHVDFTNQVLVLGTMHYLTIKGGPNPQAVKPVQALLEKFHPDVIGVEALPGEDIARMVQLGGSYHDVVKQFAGDTVKYGQLLQKHFGGDWVTAGRQADRLLANSASLTADQRVRLAAELLAAYDYSSALLQWSYLPQTVRTRTTLIPQAARDFLNKRLSGTNEIQQLAIPLARARHLQRIVAIDSQFDGARMLAIPEKELDAIEKNPAYVQAARSTLYKDSEARVNRANADGNLLPAYEYLNTSGFMHADVANQWGVWWRMKLPSGIDRMRYALWEVRNMRIAAHVADAAVSTRPQRVLVIIGAAHKPFLDRYLGQLSSIRLVQLADLQRNGSKH